MNLFVTVRYYHPQDGTLHVKAVLGTEAIMGVRHRILLMLPFGCSPIICQCLPRNQPFVLDQTPTLMKESNVDFIDII